MLIKFLYLESQTQIMKKSKFSILTGHHFQLLKVNFHYLNINYFGNSIILIYKIFFSGYVWLDKYDIREADNRKILKLLEKENNKIRQKARKERNEEIRELVNFVRKRDKRVIAHAKLVEEKAIELKKKVIFILFNFLKNFGLYFL